jgi:hypothetical protein
MDGLRAEFEREGDLFRLMQGDVELARNKRLVVDGVRDPRPRPLSASISSS